MAGKSLAESTFRQQLDVAVIDAATGSGQNAKGAADEENMHFNPSATTHIKPGNILVVLGSRGMIERLRREGCS